MCSIRYFFCLTLALFVWSLPVLRGQYIKQVLRIDQHPAEIRYWSPENGLPTWLLGNMVGDRRGNIWLATDRGLCRFDGKQFDLHSIQELGVHKIFSIVGEDRMGNLWLMVSKKDGKPFALIFNPVTKAYQTAESYLKLTQRTGNIIRSFSLGHDLYFQTDRGQLWTYDTNWRLAFAGPATSGYYLPAGNGMYWLLEKGQNIRLKDATGADRRVIPVVVKNPNNFYLDDKGQLWGIGPGITSKGGGMQPYAIGINGEVVTDSRFQPVFQDWQHQSPEGHLYAPADKDGYVYTRAPDGRIQVLHNNTLIVDDLFELLQERYNTVLSERNFYLPDPSGGVWMKCRGGLLRVRFKPSLFTTYPQTSAFSLRGIAPLSKDVVAFNSYSGSYLLRQGGKKSTATVEPFVSNLPARNYGVGMLREIDTLWMGFGGRYCAGLPLNGGTKQIYHLNKSLTPQYDGHAFCRMPDETLVLGTRTGLLRLDRSAHSLEPYSLKDTAVYCLFKHQGEVWAGTDFGLYNLSSRQWHFNDRSNPSKSFIVYHIYADPAGIFWISTHQGLVRWQPGSTSFQWLAGTGEVPACRIHAVYPDRKGRLWISSDEGLYCYQPKSGAVHAYFEQDGLPDNECNYLAHARGSDGRLYFGTVKGLFSFYPDSLDAFNSETKIPLFVSGIDLWEPYTSKAVDGFPHFVQDGQLLIPAGVNHTSIHLSAPYFGQETVIYEWRIPGRVDRWQTESTPVINLYQAPYGQYTLEVRAYLKGNESDQSIQSLRIPIEVICPFYLRWWFIVLALTAVILSVWGWKWQRVRQIQERNRELKAIVLERTKDIQQQNILIQKQHTALQKLDEAKSRFFAHINHEFRTPLSIIYGYVDKLIRRTHADADTTDALLQIQRNVGSLKEMTEDMLEFARLDTAVLPVMPEPCHWPVFIRRIVSNFSGLAEDKEISIETNQEDGIPEWLSLDIKKTERILNNLLANALKFSPEGGKVTLSVRAEGTMMCVRVDDSGVGIPPEDLPKVFDRYFQSESNLQTGRPGFGIGLSLCREYVALLGGDIAVQSTLGAGSTFTVRLPLHPALSQYEEPQKTERVIAKPEQVAAPIQPDKPAPHVLIVEDNKDMQQYLADLLSHDYRITKVYNGKEALALLVNPQETADIDLVLSDILMPKMNGFELLHAIRNHQDTATLPFIFLTALAETENIVNGLQIGVDSYLTKPFVPEEFEARIRNLLNYRQKRIDYVSPAKTVTKPLENIETTSFPPVEAYDLVWLATLKAIVEKRLDEPGLKIESLASEMLVSERTLRNKIKAYTGLSPAEYLMKMRLARALFLLERRRYATISEVCHAVGLKNPSHFTKVFKEEYGRLPSEYFR